MNLEEFFQYLCCPKCKGDLLLRSDRKEMTCPKCVFTFPIINEIPVLFPCNVVTEMQNLFGRYWDSEEKARLYDERVEGGGSIFGTYNHESEIYGITSYLEKRKFRFFLDAGCGNGRFLATLPPDVMSVGTDASLNLLMIARQKGRGQFHVCCELEHLPFKEGFFNAVISCRVIQHIQKQAMAVQELCRVTHANGVVILELYNNWNLKTIYKNIRMSKYRNWFNYPFKLLHKSWSPFEYWGLKYDQYNNWFQVKKWFLSNNMCDVHGRGVGFGYHKYFFEPFWINAFIEKRRPNLLKKYYAMCFVIEKIIGALVPFRFFMEKFVILATKRAT